MLDDIRRLSLMDQLFRQTGSEFKIQVPHECLLSSLPWWDMTLKLKPSHIRKEQNRMEEDIYLSRESVNRNK